jgi:hypothetical protein
MIFSEYETTPMNRTYLREDQPGNEVWGTAVRYLSESERSAYRLDFREGKIYDANGTPFDTRDAATVHSGDDRAIFIMDKNGNFFASKAHQVGEFHHSSLSAGESVAAAGEMEVEKGILKLISDRSGHYKPDQRFIRQAIACLELMGIDTASVLQERCGG